MVNQDKKVQTEHQAQQAQPVHQEWLQKKTTTCMTKSSTH